MTTVLCGNNRFLISSKLHTLEEAFIAEHGDLALEKLDAEESTFEQILGAIESLPFLATKKMVIVSNLFLNKQASEKVEQLVQQAGDSTDLVLVEHNIDKRSAYYKYLKKLEGFTELNELDEQGLVNWLASEAKAQSATLSASDARYLVQRVGVDQLRLSNELTKLVQYNPAISKSTIDLLTDESPSSTIFNLIDSIFSGNTKRALAIYDEQRKLRVEPQAIHGMLVWQMHAVAIVSAAPKSLSAAQIAKDSGMSPFVIQKSQRIANAMSREDVISFMKLLRDIDHRSKHKAIDYDEALRYAILSLAK